MFIADKTRPVIERIADQESFGINDIDDATEAGVRYIGREDRDGKWAIQKFTETTMTVIRYATEHNNKAYSTYSSAWTDRTSLTYELFSQAF
jgi:hypothetical protein